MDTWYERLEVAAPIVRGRDDLVSMSLVRETFPFPHPSNDSCT